MQNVTPDVPRVCDPQSRRPFRRRSAISGYLQRSNFAHEPAWQVSFAFPRSAMAASCGMPRSFPMKMIRLTGLALIWALAATLHAQTYKDLVDLNNTNDSFINAFYFGNLAQSRGGYMVGTVPSNSVRDGVAMRISTAGVQTILHEFD